ncbi:myotrophin-like [Actinia tenebrosa]|uniref:Myotrophin-like n=1 Tax=Actinia tenebrosa TaxID=6105 RepID=A0A6P8HWI5_ACTTE|nr:myotrophin-like [Actinia tenebrosa]
MNILGENVMRKKANENMPRTPTLKRRLEVPAVRQRQRSLSMDEKILLNWAVSRNDIDTVKGIVESARVDINERGTDGFYPLHRAATTGSMDCLKFLIEKGAAVEVYDKDGLSPLDVAVYEGEYDCALLLIEKGANISHIKYGYLEECKMSPKTRKALKKRLSQCLKTDR